MIRYMTLSARRWLNITKNLDTLRPYNYHARNTPFQPPLPQMALWPLRDVRMDYSHPWIRGNTTRDNPWYDNTDYSASQFDSWQPCLTARSFISLSFHLRVSHVSSSTSVRKSSNHVRWLPPVPSIVP